MSPPHAAWPARSERARPARRPPGRSWELLVAAAAVAAALPARADPAAQAAPPAPADAAACGLPGADDQRLLAVQLRRLASGDGAERRLGLRLLLAQGEPWLPCWAPRLDGAAGATLRADLEALLAVPGAPDLEVAGWRLLWRLERDPRAFERLVARLPDRSTSCAPRYRDCRRVEVLAPWAAGAARGLVEQRDPRAVPALVAYLEAAAAAPGALALLREVRAWSARPDPDPIAEARAALAALVGAAPPEGPALTAWWAELRRERFRDEQAWWAAQQLRLWGPLGRQTARPPR